MAEPTIIVKPKPKFALGQVVVTDSIVAACQDPASPLRVRFVHDLLARHEQGDWGASKDAKANDAGLASGDDRLWSVWHIEDGEKKVTVWIITEWDRSATTVLLPSDY